MRIEGYAVVGDDDRITDAAGQMPDALKNDAEWVFFQDGLDAADIVALGRRSHDVTPNPRRRRRLVLTRSVARAERQGGVVFWNPAGASLEAAVEAFGCPVQHIAVAGGREVFDYFLPPPHGYTAFHLSQIEGVTLPGGTGVFSAVETGGLTAVNVLASFGYGPASTRTLDSGVHVVTWVPNCA
jgi:dihydrofolate reductase